MTQHLITAGAPAVLTLLEDSDTFRLPQIGGINEHLLFGGLMLFFADDLLGKGELSRSIASAGLGIATIGAVECARAGTVLTGAAPSAPVRRADAQLAAKRAAIIKQRHRAMGDDEIGDDEIGDDEIGDDE